MKKRYAWMLILLVMLFAALPGRAFAAAIPFTAGSAVKGLNKNGKAVCGTEISFDPKVLFNEQMMEPFSEGNDYEFDIDSNVLFVSHPEPDPDGIYRLNILDDAKIPGGSFRIVFTFATSSGEICFESESIDIVGDISKDGDVLDCDETRIYNGKPQTQPLLVFFYSVGIEEGKDYTVSYTNNINAGTATVTINGKGCFIGSMTRTFKIDKANLSDAENGAITEKTYTGSQITQSVKVKTGGQALTGGKDYTVSYKNAGTASLTITGKDNCTGNITKTFQIKKATNLKSVRKKTVTTSATSIVPIWYPGGLYVREKADNNPPAF